MPTLNSDVVISNVALARLGADSIRDFNENNKRARLTKSLYDYCLDSILGEYNWSFARKIETLKKLDQTSLLSYVYAIPSDCLNPIKLHPFGKFDQWEVIGNTIHTDVDAASLLYTSQETNPVKFTTPFISALVELMVSKLAPGIVQDKTLPEKLEAAAERALMKAIENDANTGETYRENMEEPDLDPFVTGNDLNYANLNTTDYST